MMSKSYLPKKFDLTIDWRFLPDSFVNEAQIKKTLSALCKSFGEKSLRLIVDRPLSLDDQRVIELLQSLKDYPDLSLVLPTFLDQPQSKFVKFARMLKGRLGVTVFLEPRNLDSKYFVKRLVELLALGIRPAIIWTPDKSNLSNISEVIEKFNRLDLAVLLLPRKNDNWGMNLPHADLFQFYRFSVKPVLKYLLLENNVQGQHSHAGQSYFTVQADGTVFETPRDISKILGNIHNSKIKFSKTPVPYRNQSISDILMLLALLPAKLTDKQTNPVHSLMLSSGIKLKTGKIIYPNRFVDFECEQTRKKFGLPTLKSNIWQKIKMKIENISIMDGKF